MMVAVGSRWPRGVGVGASAVLSGDVLAVGVFSLSLVVRVVGVMEEFVGA